MNCTTCRDLLLEYIYGELDEARRGEVEAHLTSCDDCRTELETLSLGRAAVRTQLQHDRGDNSAVLAGVFDQAPPQRRRRPAGWLLVPLATAAAAILAIGLWVYLPDPASPAKAAPMGEVKLVRKDLSLTIFSTPPRTTTAYPGPLSPDRNKPWRLGQWGTGYVHGWPGLALVRDERAIANLKAGTSTVRFDGVPTAILPTSVRLDSDRDGVQVLEQNYQYDLATASAVLERYIDRTLTVRVDQAQDVTGKLLSYDDRFLVLQPSGEGPRSIDRSAVTSVSFPDLPEGLLTRPTLMWQVDNRGAARQDLTVAYLTYGLQWRADYVVKLSGRQETVATDEGHREIYDYADLAGYATVTNNSGVTFEEAQLKLMAGDVRVILPSGRRLSGYLETDGAWVQEQAQFGGFEQKSFFEYHLYTLGRKTTIREAETKQIELMTAAGVKMKRRYIYRPQQSDRLVQVVSELINEEANQLGKPLPKGTVRLWARPDADSEPLYAASSQIDHTPKDEKLTFTWGHAFDLVGEARSLSKRKLGDAHRREAWRYKLRNHKDHAVSVTLVRDVPPTTYDVQANHPWRAGQVGLIEIDVTVQPGGEAVVEWTHAYNHLSGRWVGRQN